MTVFLAWLGASVLYTVGMCLSGWAYTGHWPVHHGYCVVVGVIAGIGHGARALKAAINE